MHFFSKILDTFAKDFIYFCYMDGDFDQYRSKLVEMRRGSSTAEQGSEMGSDWQSAVRHFAEILRRQDFPGANEYLTRLAQDRSLPERHIMRLRKIFFERGIGWHLGEAQEARYDPYHPEVYAYEKGRATAFFDASRFFGIEVRPEIIRQLNILP